MNLRKALWQAGCRIMNGLSREEALDEVLERGDAQSRAFCTMILYGGCRWHLPLRVALQRRFAVKLPEELWVLVSQAWVQFHEMDKVPDYALFKETLNLCQGKWRGLLKVMSWVLSRFRDLASEDFNEFLPSWFCTSLLECGLGDQILALESLWVQRQPKARFSLQERKIDRKNDFDFSLEEMDVNFLYGDFNAMQIPGLFASGETARNHLDLCSAPGNKLMISALLYPDLLHVGVELDPLRFSLLEKRLCALGISCSLVCQDAVTFLKNTTTGFDRILLDPPCSALGTVLTHPEYLKNKQEQDFTKVEQIQKNLISQAEKILCEGGTLIYSVCTFRKEEGVDCISDFLVNHPEFKEIRISSPGFRRVGDGPGFFLSLDPEGGRQIFYVCLLRKGSLV